MVSSICSRLNSHPNWLMNTHSEIRGSEWKNAERFGPISMLRSNPLLVFLSVIYPISKSMCSHLRSRISSLLAPCVDQDERVNDSRTIRPGGLQGGNDLVMRHDHPISLERVFPTEFDLIEGVSWKVVPFHQKIEKIVQVGFHMVQEQLRLLISEL